MTNDNETKTDSAPVNRVVGRMRDERNMTRYIAESSDEHSHSVTLTIFEVQAWEDDGEDTPCEPFEEVAVFYVKWDGCAHVGFRSPDMGKNWVHVCGVDNMRLTIRMMEWAWDLSVNILKSRGFDDERNLTTISPPNHQDHGADHDRR